MKPRNICREVDKFGRVVIPIEMRRMLGENKDSDKPLVVEIYSLDNKIIIRKKQNSCALCGREDQLTEFNEKFVCKYCINELKRLDK